MMKTEIPTPALLVDLDAFERNVARVARETEAAGKRLRPHVKAHKCLEIAKRQMAAGACGLCVATVSEAELMARAGLRDLLLTSPVADPRKMRRIVATGAMVVVDHIRQVEWYQEAAHEADTPVSVLVDLDVGDHRTGAASPESALEIGVAIDRSSHLRLRGVQAYSVAGSHGASPDERRPYSQHAFGLAGEVRDAMARHGLNADIVSGGSTGTWDVDLAIPLMTELQAGSYALMDLQYRKFGVDFENAMTVLATVISANHEGFVTLDAGFKAFSTDRAYGPLPIGAVEGAGYRWGGDEFGYIDPAAGAKPPRLGDKVELLPPHCDPTVNLHDRIWALRGDRVEEVWGIMDRFAGQPGE